MIEEIRRASILKKKILDEVDYQEGRELLVTVIEQNFTNFNRCLFIVKVETPKIQVSNINAGEHKEGTDKKLNHQDKQSPERSFISGVGSKNKLKISTTKLKEGLSNFMFDLYPDDQRYQSKHN